MMKILPQDFTKDETVTNQLLLLPVSGTGHPKNWSSLGFTPCMGVNRRNVITI